MNLRTLLESANPYTALQAEANKLANKWVKTGLLEGLGETEQNNMAMLLENQMKQVVVESSQTGGGIASQGTFTPGVGEQWAAVALPMVRKVFGSINAKDFVSVQTMNLPSGLVFFLDFQYGSDKAPFAAGNSLYGTPSAGFGNEAAGGLYGAGRFGYSINDATATIDKATATVGTATSESVNFDAVDPADFETLTFPLAGLANADLNAVRSFVVDGQTAASYPAYTKIVGTNLVLVLAAGTIANTAGVPDADFDMVYSLQPTDKNRGDFEDGNTALNADNAPISIPELNVQMRSDSITAKTRKLKAAWTPEFAQDLNAYQNVDAEVELSNIMSEYIGLEIDLEILDMLIQNAGAGSEVWSAVSNKVFSDTTGNGTTIDPGYFNTQGQWFQTLGTKINKLSNIIHQRTLRGGANFMVLSPKVSTIIESIPGFAADVNGDVEKSNYNFGVQKMGALGGGKIKVYKNPYMVENQILLGYKGSQFLETGAVFAPYIPLIMTPLVYDPETFTPRKGLLTRYAKKMVRPEFYGLIKVDGLNTI